VTILLGRRITEEPSVLLQWEKAQPGETRLGFLLVAGFVTPLSWPLVTVTPS
jgi:hypothetical protein